MRNKLTRLALLLALLTLGGLAVAPAMAANSQIRIYPRPGFESRFVGVIVQVSNDNATWTQVGTLSPSPAASVYTTYALSADISTYKYIRCSVAQPAYLDVTEVEFDNMNSGSAVVLQGKPIGSTPYGGDVTNYGPQQAFDANLSTFYTANDGGTANQPIYFIGLDRTAQLSPDSAAPASVSAGPTLRAVTVTSTAANFVGTANFTSTFAPASGYTVDATHTATTIASQSTTDTTHAVVNLSGGNIPGTVTLADQRNAGVTLATAVTILSTATDQLGTVTTTTIAAQGGAAANPGGTVTHRWAYNTTAANTIAASTLIAAQTTAALSWTSAPVSTPATPYYIVHEVTDGVTTLTQIVPAQLKDAPIGVLVIGDSLYARHGNTGSLSTEQFIAQDLQAMAGNRTLNFYFAAVSGMSSSAFAQGGSQYANAVAAPTAPPNFIVYKIGTNDANAMTPASDILANIQSTIAGMTTKWPGVIFLIMQPHDFQPGPYFTNPASLPQLESYRTLVYSAVADGVTTFLADPNALWAGILRSHPEWYENDLVHLNDNGVQADAAVESHLLAPFMGLTPPSSLVKFIRRIN